MKLLVACSSLDLDVPFSATPAWWQLLKGLDESGAELVVTTYHGRASVSPWWKAYPNPAWLEGEIFMAMRRLIRRVGFSRDQQSRTSFTRERPAQWLARNAARSLIAPKWRRHLTSILRIENDVDAVVLIALPPNQIRGVAADIREEFSIPVVFLDGDVPASLPSYGGFASGFDIYHGADLQEFDIVLSNSQGGAQNLLDLGARSVHTLYYAADPSLYTPLNVSKDIDVFFYGHTTEFREIWMQKMLNEAATQMPGTRFAARGIGLGPLDPVELQPYRSFSTLRRYIARSRINLVIVRQPHASVYASSILRPFEIAMMGACMVSNPWLGVEEWFEPDKEIIIVHSTEEAVDRYSYFLSNETERIAIGQAARQRALSQHTYRQRAEELIRVIKACC